ncbi:MAG TPA: dephospho-CoA kinase [Gaiellaceae bacterium]|nr:dephospho-CoA kinase [Gaiellaceae bacterium]
MAGRLLAVAITGGIAAGKTEALAAFERRGAVVSSADAIVHRIYREDGELKDELRARWGDRVFDAAGEVDRGAVAAIVFADPDELAWLERVLHPRVARAHEQWLAELAARPDPPELVVVEIPLLYETGGEARYDKVVVVTASRAARAGRRGGGFEARESRLIADDEKVRRADFAYVNDGSLEELDAFVAGVVEELASSS